MRAWPTWPLFSLLVATLASQAAQAQQSSRETLVEKGAYLARAGDCAACHSVSGGKAYAGGLAMETPVGTIYSTNITPDAKTGIGRYTLEEFSRALRQGKARDGHPLYPAMPYPSYAKITDADVRALYAYIQHDVDPVSQANRQSEIPWPLNMRWPLNIWSWLFAPDEEGFTADAERSDAWNRGAYLVEGLGHCGACHTPRGLAYQEKGLAAGDSDFLAGENIEGWHAFNITSDEAHGIGGWSDEQLLRYLQTGSVPGLAQAAGPMGEAIGKSLRYLDDADLRAMVSYLKSVPAVGEDGTSRFGQGAPADDVDQLRGVALDPQANDDGARLYLGACASCHGAHGEGSTQGHYPPLMNSSVVGTTHVQNLVRVILDGVQRDTGDGELLMPHFADQLSDAQVASLVNYLTARFGNPDAETLDAAAVSERRRDH